MILPSFDSLSSQAVQHHQITRMSLHPTAPLIAPSLHPSSPLSLFYTQVEDIAPAEIRKTFEHHHEWDGGASVAAPTDSQAPVPSENAPYNAITFDPDKCIKCGRCVAICQKIQGIGAIGFVGRGAEEHVSTVQGLPLDRTKCIECGQVRREIKGGEKGEAWGWHA